MVDTVYIEAPSKKELNRQLAAGQSKRATSYSHFGDKVYFLPEDDLPDKTVVKIYNHLVGGVPYAKSYGNWDAKKKRVK